MKKRSDEILAPAGNPESLRAAVFSGADAVYLAGKNFGARASAANFTDEELKSAVRFAHARSVKLYVTVNTLIKNRELKAALSFVEYLCSLPVDAVLVQDPGLFLLIRERAPGLALHASTQMSLHTPAGVRLIGELGASRVVLARELSLGEIREIAGGSEIELEAFVHGALCICVSGQCYMSAMLGSRSGNRGMCAQPCRLPFSCGSSDAALSLKDLSFAENVNRLFSAGVTSAKIEGRMKRPEYVAAAVSACVKARKDGAAPAEIEALRKVFSRSGFTDGYLTARRGRDMFGTRRREDVVCADEKLLSSLRASYRAELQRVGVSMSLTEKDGSLHLSVSDSDGLSAVSIINADASVPAIAPKRCTEQLKKTGGTPFYPLSVNVPEGGVRAPVSTLNSLRREALEKLEEMRASRARPVEFEKKALNFGPVRHAEKLNFRASFSSFSQVPDCAKKLDCIYLPLETPMPELIVLRERGFNIFLDMPRAMFGAEKELSELVKERMASGFSDYVCGNLGALALCRELGAETHGSFSLNITNTASANFFERLGIRSIELSFELKLAELKEIGTTVKRGIMIYGRQALMLTRNCPACAGNNGCGACRGVNSIEDRRKTVFPVMCRATKSGKNAEILNSVPLYLFDRLHALNGLDFGVLRFTVENPVESGEKIESLFRQESPQGDYTRGLFYRGIE